MCNVFMIPLVTYFLLPMFLFFEEALKIQPSSKRVPFLVFTGPQTTPHGKLCPTLDAEKGLHCSLSPWGFLELLTLGP